MFMTKVFKIKKRYFSILIFLIPSIAFGYLFYDQSNQMFNREISKDLELALINLKFDLGLWFTFLILFLFWILALIYWISYLMKRGEESEN